MDKGKNRVRLGLNAEGHSTLPANKSPDHKRDIDMLAARSICRMAVPTSATRISTISSMAISLSTLTIVSPTRSSILSSFLSRPSLAAPPFGQCTLGLRFVTYGREYQPSQLVRKRRHGFLARKRSKGGRRILKRRMLRGRKSLSH